MGCRGFQNAIQGGVETNWKHELEGRIFYKIETWGKLMLLRIVNIVPGFNPGIKE